MDKIFWLSKIAYVEIRELAAMSYPDETGGMLLGYVANDASIVVKAIIGPGPKAQHFRHRFLPDVDYQQCLLDKHHMRTGGVESYLGDWHTHPDGVLQLSRRDKSTLRNIAAAPEAAMAQPVMAIFGPGRADWNIAAFRLIAWRDRVFFKTHVIAKLSPQTF